MKRSVWMNCVLSASSSLSHPEEVPWRVVHIFPVFLHFLNVLPWARISITTEKNMFQVLYSWSCLKKKKSDDEQCKTPMLVTQTLQLHYFLARVFANSRKQKLRPVNVGAQFLCLLASQQFINSSTGITRLTLGGLVTHKSKFKDANEIALQHDFTKGRVNFLTNVSARVLEW